MTAPDSLPLNPARSRRALVTVSNVDVVVLAVTSPRR